MVSLILSLILVFYVLPSISAEGISVSAASAVLINLGGEIIFGKNEKERLPMASTTKIMTALIASEQESLYEDTAVSAEGIKVEGTSMGLKEGDKASFYDLIVGMLLSSGNDAANETARRIAGSNEKFSEVMNKRAREIGMKDTNFVTPSGLHHDEHYSTAYDMALLGREAIGNPLIGSVCSSKSINVAFGNEPFERTLYNHNKLLTLDGGYIGIKTGYTKKAGRCLVSACEREGTVLIAVTLNAPDDWNDHEKLYEYGFSLMERKEEKAEKYSLKVFGGERDFIEAYSEEISFNYIGAEPTEKVFLPQGVYAPVNEGDIVGSVTYFLGEEEIYSSPIIASEDISAREGKPTIFKRVMDFFRNFFKLR